jgi:hypothetical protein
MPHEISSMNPSWKRFLFVRLPVAGIAVGLLCQLIAVLLANLPLRRNAIDEMALAVLNDRQPHRIVLLGDSIIRDATRSYGVGSLTDVLNMTTQGFVGLAGDMFLLERYLQTHRPPEYVVIAAAPDDYDANLDPRMVHYYMWNTFTKPNERAFLKQFLPTIDAREHDPAAMDLQERIIERLITLTRPNPARFYPPPPPPDAQAPLESASDNLATPEAQESRLRGHTLALAPMDRAAMSGLCQLGRRYGFSLNVVWAPMPPLVVKGRAESGQLMDLNNQLHDIFTSIGCEVAPIFNMNDVQTFTNFDSLAFHLRGSGWEQRAVLILSQYLHALPDRSHMPPTLLKPGGPVSADAGLNIAR